MPPLSWGTFEERPVRRHPQCYFKYLAVLPGRERRFVSEAPLYLESDHEATDPKTSLCSAAQQNTQTQSDPAWLFLLISSEVPRATHVAVLQCLIAIVINSL